MNDKKAPERVYSGCVGVSKNYLVWHWKVEQSINNKFVQERRRCSVKYTVNSLQDGHLWDRY